MAATPGAITLRDGAALSTSPQRPSQVEAGGSATIAFGTPVVTTLGSPYVVAGTDAIPVVGTDFMVGIAATNSDETASADGHVGVLVMEPETVYLCDAKSPAAIDTQAEYDALVGNRVLFDLTANVWTVDESAAHSTNNGLVIVDSDIKKYPGKVAFVIRQSSSYLN